jgi:hypothetical protein
MGCGVRPVLVPLAIQARVEGEVFRAQLVRQDYSCLLSLRGQVTRSGRRSGR